MKLDIKKAVITGATGMIAATLIEYLIDKNIKVYAICRPNSKKINNIKIHPLVNIIECDLIELESVCNKILEPCDIFFHFAWNGTFGDARNDTYLQTYNIKYTLDAVSLAYKLNCKKFIGAGSQAEYGLVDGKIKGCSPTSPVTGYGIGKLTAGNLSRILCNQLGMEYNWTRILSVYGPYDNDYTLIMSTISKLLHGEKTAFTKGEQDWDYLFSKDISKAFYLIAKYGVNGKVYPLGSGTTRKLSDYIIVLRNLINPNAELFFGEIPYQENQVMYLCADISELTKDTGFLPEYSFEDGMKETIEWYRKEYAK